MSKKILIINAGSSSIKFKLFEESGFEVIASGLCERIYIDGFFKVKYKLNGEEKVFEGKFPMPDHVAAINVTLEKFKELNIIHDITDIAGIGHRIVQGGATYSDSVLVDEKSVQVAKSYIKLAPLHNEPEVKVVEIFQKLLPNATSILSFDTAFHATIPAINYTYPLDKEIAKKYLVRKYGMHGTSYKFITKKMKELLNKDKVNLIVCHLGNGASLCAIKDNLSFNTSMGLTPLEGVMMGTRCGDIDPSTALYLIRQGFTVDQVDEIFNKKSGFKGIAGSADLRDVRKYAEEGNKDAIFSLKLYAHTVANYIVRYANDLENKIDAIVFTAGIGENDGETVRDIIQNVHTMGLTVDHEKALSRFGDYKIISTSESSCPIYVVRTDEELMIAQDVERFMK